MKLFPLKFSTASQEVPLGKFVDSADGNTAETGLTIANTDIKLWKSGATALVDKNSGGATHMAGGEYYAVLDATDTNTLGPMKISVHVGGALYVQLFCIVLPANVYEALITGTEWLEVTTLRNSVSISGTTITVKKPDGTTTQYTKTGSFDPDGQPIIGLS